MHKFNLENRKFYSYNNRHIYADKEFSLTEISENSLLKLVAYNIIQKDPKNKPQLSFRFKLKRFFKYFKWGNRHYTSNFGKINDTHIFIDETLFYLKKITRVTFLNSSELRDLLISAIRIYEADNWSHNTPIEQADLKRCVNLQEFHSAEVQINFDFAENLRNLRIINLFVNDANNEYGIYKRAHYKHKTGTVRREVLNVDKLKSCKVLYLVDSNVNDYYNLPNCILALSLRNSNFENLQNLIHLNKLEYLDISYTNLFITDGLSKLTSLRILNIYCSKFNEPNDAVKLLSEITSLNKLEILIIDNDNLKLMLDSDLINLEQKNKIINVHLKYKGGEITIFEICELLKIVERVKLENDESTYDFWNTPMGEVKDKKSNEVIIDYEEIKMVLKKKIN